VFAAIDEQSTLHEPVGSQTGAKAASDTTTQFVHVQIELPRSEGKRVSDSKTELGASAKSNMLGRRGFNLQIEGVRGRQSGRESMGEAECPIGQRSRRRPIGSQANSEADPRFFDHETDTAEAAEPRYARRIE
jgi:hypothetical protein